MFAYFVLILILFQIQGIESLFVSVGDYSKESITGLNTPECGLNVVAIVHTLIFNKKCFRKEYKDQSFEFFENNQRNNGPIISERVNQGYEFPVAFHTPWVVYVKPKIWGGALRRYCAGALITFQWVLTSAHCFEDNEWKKAIWAGVYLSVGSNSEEGTQTETVKKYKWFPHPLYVNPSIPGREEPLSDDEKLNIKIENDLALIRINFKQETTSDNKYLVNTICLPKRDEMNERDKERAYFFGYGKINDNSFFNKYPEYLQVGGVDLHPSRSCNPSTLLCGTSYKNDPKPCEGDSGGPLVQNMPGPKIRTILAGILRGGTSEKCDDMKTTYWVPVSTHIDWILNTTRYN